jgi:hypothetical protein
VAARLAGRGNGSAQPDGSCVDLNDSSGVSLYDFAFSQDLFTGP